MGEVRQTQWRRWTGRANTIHAKAEELFSELVGTLGVEHGLTDYADDVVCEADQLVSALERYRSRPTPSKEK